jgi:hypothetical protein
LEGSSRKLAERYAMVCGREGPTREAEKGRGSILVRCDDGILEAVSREKPRRDTGFLVYDSQQGNSLALVETIVFFLFFII